MRKKQWIALLITILLSQGSTLIAGENIMNQEVKTSVEVTTEETPQAIKEAYISKSGKITEINNEGNYYSILVGTPTDGIRYVLDNNEIIIDAETLGYLQSSDLKVGMEIEIIVREDVPMTLSLPPMISEQEILIVNPSKSSIEVDYFGQTLVNEKNTLALNIGEDTYITSTTGEKRIFTEEDIKNKSLVVIYTMSTRSIPAQTTPEMVLILQGKKNNIEEIIPGEIIQEEKGASVRYLAEKYEYDISWDNKTKSVILVKGNNKITLTVGKREFVHNGKVQSLEKMVILENGKVYVPDSLTKIL